MRNHDPSTTFMTEVYSRITNNKEKVGVRKDLLRNDLKDTSTVETNLGPCLLMGLASWVMLYTLYGLLN